MPTFFFLCSSRCWWLRLKSPQWGSFKRLPSKLLACFPVKPNYKKRHPRIASCCLHVVQQPLQSQCSCPRGDVLCPAGCWTLGKWSQPLMEGPDWPPCCRRKSGRGCCTGVGERWHFHRPAGTGTRSGFVLLWRDNNSISRMVAPWKHGRIHLKYAKSGSWVLSGCTDFRSCSSSRC